MVCLAGNAAGATLTRGYAKHGWLRSTIAGLARSLLSFQIAVANDIPPADLVLTVPEEQIPRTQAVLTNVGGKSMFPSAK